MSFLKVLPDDFKYAFGFRNSSWFNDQTYEMLGKYNVKILNEKDFEELISDWAIYGSE